MNLISYVLWGNDPLYCQGAVTNIIDARKYYPNWQNRFYVFEGCGAVAELNRLGAQVIMLPPIRRRPDGNEDWAALLYRLHPMSEPGIDRVIFRDTDCRFTTKEEAAVQAWIDSKKDVHAFYKEDRIQPKIFSGGMWGIKAGVIKNIRYRIERWLGSKGIAFWNKGEAPDELFILEELWPELKDETLYHGGGFSPFPVYVSDEREEFMGEKMEPGGLRVLHWFRHGLGDAVQFTAVLRHLKHFHPDWVQDVCSLKGKHTAFTGLCRDTLMPETRVRHDNEYDKIYRHDWNECHHVIPGHPSTKAAACLTEVFKLPIVRELLHYQVSVGDEARQRARAYADTLHSEFCLLHYQGNTSQASKNMTHEEAGATCEAIIRAGFTPVILDWDRRSRLIDNVRVFCPDRDNPLWQHTGTGDAETIAALADLSALNIGIDSGPQKVFLSRRTPCICFWKLHHPIHYADYCENALHLVCSDHARHVRGDQPAGLKFFQENYTHAIYQDAAKDLASWVALVLAGQQIERPKSNGELIEARANDGTLFWIRPDNREQDLCVLQDVYEKDSYRLKEVPFTPNVIVDVGAHIGAFSRKASLLYPWAKIAAVEACPENIAALSKALHHDRTVVIHAACTYQESPVLLNSVFPNCESTGGSIVCKKEDLAKYRREGYWPDSRPLPTITLEQIMERIGTSKIDILKLDCEGSEFSILTFASAACLKSVKLIIGEWHDCPDKGGIHHGNFQDLIAARFQGWPFRILKSEGNFGTFWLSNPDSI